MPRISQSLQQMTRDKLLAAAADEFACAGLEGANINRISTAAGFAKGTVYNYFVSKEALFFEVVRQACVRAAADAADVPETPTRDRLRALVVSDMDWARRQPAFARVFLQVALSGDRARMPAVMEAAAPFMDRVEALLREGVARQEVQADVPIAELALWFVGLSDLALVQHFASDGTWPTLDEIPDLVIRQFLQGAQGPSESIQGTKEVQQ